MNPNTRQFPTQIDLAALEPLLSCRIVRDPAPARLHADVAVNNTHASMVGELGRLEDTRPALTDRDVILFFGILTSLAGLQIVRCEDGSVSTADLPFLSLLQRRNSERDYAVVKGHLPGTGYFRLRIDGGGGRCEVVYTRYPGVPHLVHDGDSTRVWHRNPAVYGDAVRLVQEVATQGGVYVVNAALGDSTWTLLVQDEGLRAI